MSENFSVQCETCGGRARIEVIRPMAEPGFRVSVSCHGMHSVKIAKSEDDLRDVLLCAFVEATRLPPLLDEFRIEPDTPQVEENTWKPVRPELEPHLRLGMMVKIDGEYGVVIGHDRNEHKCLLG